MSLERWKPIPSEPGYEVSDLGRVRSVDRNINTTNGQNRFYRGRLLKPGQTGSGHMTVACGKGNSRYVHVLILEAFVGPCPAGMESLHANDVAWDNRLDNLRWGTRSENMYEAYRNGCR